MTKEKQIEEMAKIALRNTMSYTCAKQIAMNFYIAGYRKASDVAREIFEEIKKPLIDYFDSKDKEYSTMKIKSTKQLQIATAHYQGATNAIAFVFNLIAELKKKYTEEGK